MQHRNALRRLGQLVAAGATIALLLGSSQALTASASGDPLAKAQQELDEAREAANNAATLFQQALSKQSELEDEITRLEREIPALRAQADQLRENIQRRTAQLYVNTTP